MANTKKFSIAMSVYQNDHPIYFKTALDSIINQTAPPSEIILTVDGPVSSTLAKVIKEYKSKCKCLKPIYVEKKTGLGNALRLAVEASNNELVARMDSDDISVPDRFEKQLMCFEKNQNLSLLGGNISEFIGDESNIIGRRIVPTEDRDIKNYLKKRCPFNHVTVMFKKSQVLKAGNYRDWFWNEDYYLWVRMHLAGCRFGNLPDNLVHVRVGPEMYKRRGGIRYFKSEAKLQSYMLHHGIINFPTYISNVSIRFIFQVLMPNTVRGFLFKKLARK